AHSKLQPRAAVRIGRRCGSAHLPNVVIPPDVRAQPVRAFERWSGQLALGDLDFRQRLAADTMNSNYAICDFDRLQGEPARYEGQIRPADLECAPVAAAVLVNLQPEDRSLDLDLPGLDNSLQQRRQGEPHREAVGTEERLAGRGIGYARLFETDVRRRQEAERDVAAHAYLTAQHARGLRLENAAIGVPIDRVRHRKQRREQHHDQTGDPEEG